MQFKEDNWESLYIQAKKLAEERVSFSEIEQKLSEKENDSVLISEIIKQLRKTQHAIQMKNGLRKIVFGALFLIIGFLITCINFHSNQSFTIVMYSFTTIGLCLIFWALYDIFG